MFERWGEYFFMLGSSAAALIGLMFVVTTLTAGRDRSELEPGKKLYTSPIVGHLVAVLLLSGEAIAPTLSPAFYGSSCGLVAVFGFVTGVRVAIGIRSSHNFATFGYEDMFWYGAGPALSYLGLGVAAAGLLLEASWSISAVAAVLMVLVIIAIRNEWDLVTFLAPTATSSENSAQGG
jgi:hypothetical protein